MVVVVLKLDKGQFDNSLDPPGGCWLTLGNSQGATLVKLWKLPR